MNSSSIKWLEKYSKDNIVIKAYEFAKEAHKNDLRKTGDPFVVHCLEVARTVERWGLDEATIVAALLHDVVEDTSYTLKDIKDNFGKEIAFLVDGLTKVESLQYTGNKGQAENMRKLMIVISEDLRVIFIKLSDRWHNMKTLGVFREEKQKRIAKETTEIYAPLAYRLGMQWLSGELEDLAFPYIHPQEYKWLIKTVDAHFKERQKYAEKVKPKIAKILKKNNIEPVKIDARAKRYSSLYKKLLRYDMNLDKVHDLVALRIIVKTIEDCYAVLGMIHKEWPPLPGRVKDYIALPKPNGYRSLHTTVFCVNDKITEFQIRTEEMHEEAEMGAAAHWAYQQTKGTKTYFKNKSQKANEKDIAWIKQLNNWSKNFEDSEKFMQSLKVDFFKDRIFVVTPEHDVVDLPAGATPIDFAYRIHTEIGNQCSGAKVNGNIVPLDYELRSGDIVDIMTQRGKKPSESWLEFVKTSMAKERIKSSMRKKSSTFKKRLSKPNVTIKIITEDRSGLIKDVSSVFSELKVNIININSQRNHDSSFHNVSVKCGFLNQKKIEKILVKIRKIKEIKEVSFSYDN
ncbi:MAG: RelA/SpoT family protein [Candidatus Paceibacterota bacterium]